MSSSVPSRSLSLRPFLVVDGVLLLTALLIAWRSSGELAGGALFGVIFCIGLGAVLTVLPFVINDARERETALAERQRELVDLVNSSTATASRWGTQWTAAATGLEAAAGLATRNLAVAERLPAVFQDKIDAVTLVLEQAELGAKAREERAAEWVKALDARSAHAASVAAELERTLAGFDRMESGLRVEQVALATTLERLPATVAQAGVVVADLGGTLTELVRTEAFLREGHAALDHTLARLPEAGAKADAVLADLGLALADFVRVETGLREQQTALATTMGEITAAGARAGAILTNALQQALSGLDGAASGLREQHAAFVATLAEFPTAAARVQSVREVLDERLAAVPAQIEAQVARGVAEAELRLVATAATADALTSRLAGLEVALASFAQQLEQAKPSLRSEPTSPGTPAGTQNAVPMSASDDAEIARAEPDLGHPAALPEPAPEGESEPAPTPEPAPTAAEKPAPKSVRTDSIMDPFYIPSDGYSALADAMDEEPGQS